jgi:hypothetical protein
MSVASEIWAALPADDWLVLRTRLCGICGSDYKQIFLNGSMDNPMTALISFPQVLGHEVVGTVERVGPGVRSRKPGDRVVLNPCQVGNGFIPADYIRYLDEYAKGADTFMPLPMNLNPEVVAKYAQLAKDQSKTIWTYHTIDKSTAPCQYRGIVWQNIEWGFLPTCAIWYCDSAGDPLNSLDPSVYVPTGTMDLVTGYVDQARKEVVASRREKAWYEGNQDGRAYLCCQDRIEKLKKAGIATGDYEKKLAGIVAGGRADRPTAMEEARERLLRLAVEMDKQR